MCGRFTLRSHGTFQGSRTYRPRYNIAPGQAAIIQSSIIPSSDRTAVWGWTSSGNVRRIINARMESIALKPIFASALSARRCLVPADGFFEWSPPAQGRVPHYFQRTDHRPFCFAGLYRQEDAVLHFLILTTAADDVVAAVHHRMPVILSKESEAGWLDPAMPDPLAYLRPNERVRLMRHPVSARVNRPAFDGPECVEPVPVMTRPAQLEWAFTSPTRTKGRAHPSSPA